VQVQIKRVFAIAGICAALVFIAPVAAEKAQFKGDGVSSYLMLSDGGNVLKHDGKFSVTYKDFVATGLLGEFYRPPEKKTNATTRSRVVITKDARVSKAGTDAFELTAQKLIDMDLDSEAILAKGNVQITAKSTSITADQLDAGDTTRIRPLIEKTASELGSQYAVMVSEWLSKAEPKDQLMLLDGNVKATDPQFVFTGRKLALNVTKEIYLFLGPHEIEMNLGDNQTPTQS
jgi:hypothetical protein